MTWAKLDDQFPEHPRIVGLSAKAFRLHVSSICLAARKLTDGHISPLDVKWLHVTAGTTKAQVSELLEAGVWEQNGNRFVIRDYLDYNPPAEVVKERRRKDLERKTSMQSSRRKS